MTGNMKRDALAPDLRGINAAPANVWIALECMGHAPAFAEYVAVADLPRIIARAIATDRANRSSGETDRSSRGG